MLRYALVHLQVIGIYLSHRKNYTFSAGIGEKILWPALYGMATPFKNLCGAKHLKMVEKILKYKKKKKL